MVTKMDLVHYPPNIELILLPTIKSNCLCAVW